jgi:hypothetical protein
MSWLCETGLMTPVLADSCFPDGPQVPEPRVEQEVAGNRAIITADRARQHTPAAALTVLQRWEQLSMEQQRVLTLASLADVICVPEGLCKLPWVHERLLWIGRQDESSLLHQLTPGVLRLVVEATGSACWLKHKAAGVIADLRAQTA